MSGSYCYPLQMAAMCGEIDSLRSMLEDSLADINRKDSNESTALVMAIIYNKIEAVELLLDKGADPNIPKRHEYPIHLAAIGGNLGIFKLLLEHKADLGILGNFSYHTLHIAADYGRLNIVKYLVEEKKVNIYRLDSFQRTPLYKAISSKYYEVAKYLIHKSDVNQYTCLNSPLHLAAKHHNANIAKLLVSKNVNLHLRDCTGWTALHFAAHFGNFEIIKVICEAGGDYLLLTSCEKHTALHLTVESGNIFAVDYLLRKGAPINFQTPSGTTILHIAVENRNIEMIIFLTNKGADLNIQNSSKLTPLDLAVNIGNPNLINILVQNCAYFEIQNNGKCKILELLLKNNLHDYFELNQTVRSKAAAIIITFILIRNYKTQLYLDCPFDTELKEIWQYCKQKMRTLDTFFVGNTNITQYQLLKSMLNERHLALYLNNENVLNFCHYLKENIILDPIFGNLDKFLETGIKNGESRRRFVQYADYVITENVTKKLPREIRYKIINYMSITDLPFVENYET